MGDIIPSDRIRSDMGLWQEVTDQMLMRYERPGNLDTTLGVCTENLVGMWTARNGLKCNSSVISAIRKIPHE